MSRLLRSVSQLAIRKRPEEYILEILTLVELFRIDYIEY